MYDSIQVEEMYENNLMSELLAFQQFKEEVAPLWWETKKELAQSIEHLESIGAEFNEEYLLLADVFIAICYQIGVDPILEVKGVKIEMVNVIDQGVHYGVTYRPYQ